MKVKIMQRIVYHKYAEVEIELPKEITDIKTNKCYNTYGEFDLQAMNLDLDQIMIKDQMKKITKANGDLKLQEKIMGGIYNN